MTQIKNKCLKQEIHGNSKHMSAIRIPGTRENIGKNMIGIMDYWKHKHVCNKRFLNRKKITMNSWKQRKYTWNKRFLETPNTCLEKGIPGIREYPSGISGILETEIVSIIDSWKQRSHVWNKRFLETEKM